MANGAMAPPLWVARTAKLHRKVSKIEACPPPLFQVGHQALSSKSPDFGRKMGRNSSVTISNFDLCFSQIFWSFWPPPPHPPPPPPPFQNPAYATDSDYYSCQIICNLHTISQRDLFKRFDMVMNAISSHLSFGILFFFVLEWLTYCFEISLKISKNWSATHKYCDSSRFLVILTNDNNK